MRGQTAIIIVTRKDIAANDPGAYTVISHPERMGHTVVNGPHIRFKGLRVPKFNPLARPEKGGGWGGDEFHGLSSSCRRDGGGNHATDV